MCYVNYRHYFFWGVGVGTTWILLWLCGIVSTSSVLGSTCVHFLQLLLYRPQLGKGFAPYWEWLLKSKMCDYLLCYLDAWIVREAELDPNKQCVFGWAPHGILGVCRAASAGTWKGMSNIPGRWGSFGMAFYIPGAREFSLAVGAVDASKDVLEGRIRDGESIHLVPGGIREMMLTDEKSSDTKIVLKNRWLVQWSRMAISIHPPSDRPEGGVYGHG